MVTSGLNDNEEPKRRLRPSSAAMLILWTAIGAGALLLLLKSVQTSAEFGRLQLPVLILNVIGVIALVILLARKLWQLFRDYRDHVPGSRLTARTVMIFGALVVAPLLIVYLSSLEFLNRGIDSWFKVEIKQGLSDALELSKSAMDVRMREYARSTQLFANKLADSPPSNWAAATDLQRVESGALEVVVYGTLGQVLAASTVGTSTNLPRASAEVTSAIAGGNLYWSLEPLS
jgi:nitrogen fixation/metabolism regulation signal transduction histidine kinase